MRRFIIVLASITLIMLNRPGHHRPAQAAPHLQPCAQVRITSPAPGAELRGIVPIEGSAAIGDFQFYKVEYAPATQPNLWTSFSDIVRTPVVNGILDTWNTILLPDGIYHLKLTAVDIRGQEVCHWIVENLRVANTQPTATPTEEAPPTLPVPTATPTPLITATPTQPTTPTPTPTIAAIIPTRQPSLPELDTLRDSVEEAIDPQRLVDLTLLGAGVTTTIFVIVGLISLLRRII